jgi:hypothetical protein
MPGLISTVARSMRDGEWDQIPGSMILLSYNGVVGMVRID